MTKLTENSTNKNIISTDTSSNSEIKLADYSKDAEKVNGRWAMIGFIALLGAYISTGQIIPGIF